LLLLAWVSPAHAATTVWAVGDGADGGSSGEAVATMIAGRDPDTFLYLGDVYEHGTAQEFMLGYEPVYGRLKSITYPTPGNHEWDNRAAGYDPYWGPRFASPHYYSFDLGGWHVISLNSEEAYDPGSAQVGWLRSDLSERHGNCTIAFWHRPRYSAGTNHGDEGSLATFWDLLAGRASIVLTGHDHDYQRLRPIDGITSFVVGTGGHGHTPINASDPRLIAYDATTYGALRLQLTGDHADYAFFSDAGAILDSGAVACDRTKSPGSSDTRRPRITGATVNRKLLPAGGRSKRHVAFRYTLSERARVTITIQRVGKQRATSLSKLTDSGQRGLNRKLFSGKVAGRALRPASYRAVLEATDRAGNISKPKTVRFRVLRRR
jgi:hypothetical protein